MPDFKRHIPNFITLLNLLSGCIGIAMIMEDRLLAAVAFIWIAAAFDFLDGFAARLLKAGSAIGKDLDSLSDVVSFVLPALILFVMIGQHSPHPALPYAGFSVALFSALRLAKFNNDDRQSEAFIGLPTPANAILISSFPFIASRYQLVFFENPFFLAALAFLLSALLVSGIRLFSFKFKGFGFAQNWEKYCFLGLCVVLLPILHVAAIPLLVFLYIIFSVILNYFPK